MREFRAARGARESYVDAFPGLRPALQFQRREGSRVRWSVRSVGLVACHSFKGTQERIPGVRGLKSAPEENLYT
jgi:hypothetical protein